MSWIIIVITAHLLNAGAFLVDKFLLVKAIPKPVVYAFWIGILGMCSIVLLPFGFVMPSVPQLLFALVAGVFFELALLSFFAALRWLETSRVVPFVGGLQPLLILAFAFFFLGERLSGAEIIGVLVLVAGTALISIDVHDSTPSERVQRLRGWGFAFLATFCFAITFTMTKAVFETQPFITGFVTIRVGAFLLALLFLVPPSWRRAIFAKDERPKGRAGALFLSGQVAGALGAILLNYAIALASVTVVTAMQGLQYAFLFVLAMVLGKKYTQLRERLTPTIIVRKSIALIAIGIGLALVAGIGVP